MNLILAVASIFAAVIPMFTYLIIIWWLDRNEREPFGMLLLYFIWGATGAIFLGILGSIFFQIPLNVFLQTFSGDNSEELFDLAGTVITAPVVEEFTKGIFLILMAANRRFDGVADGVVYGAAVGLGFGMTENFLYFISYGTTPESWLWIVVIRTLFSAVMHMMSQATFGAFIGAAKFKPAVLKMIFIPAGFILAVFLHFSWNFSVSFEETTVLGFIFLIMYGIALFAVFQIAVYMEGKTVIRELQEEAGNGLIPYEHLKYIPYFTRRARHGWCPPGINQKDYVKTAINLALRKHQYKHSNAKNKNLYFEEVKNMRYKIQMMYYNAHQPYNNNYASAKI
ncbi:MAG TPA: PrsW family intramembrane metalloprotease [Ignavibacteria bacterium]